MNRLLLAITMIFVLTNGLIAQRKTRELDTQKQDEQKKADDTYGKNDSWKDKMIYGGSFGGGFGSSTIGSTDVKSTFFMIQPIVGYKITDKFQVGIDPLYIYSSRTYTFINKTNLTLSGSVFGPGVFGRYFINENIFAHVEYLGLNYDRYNEKTNSNISEFSNSLFVGGGYMPNGGGNGMYVLFLYDLMYSNTTSFYQSPIDIRVGFVF